MSFDVDNMPGPGCYWRVVNRIFHMELNQCKAVKREGRSDSFE